MEIKGTLINSERFKFCKESLALASEKDHKEDFRVKTLNYINERKNMKKKLSN